MSENIPYDWKCHPDAEQFILDYVQKAVQLNPFISELENRLLHKASSRLFDWLDHIVITKSKEAEKVLQELGFVVIEEKSPHIIYFHPGAQLPRVVFSTNSQWGVAINADSIADFLLAHSGLSTQIEGMPFGSYRKALVNHKDEVCLWVVERRATQLVDATAEKQDHIQRYLQASEMYSNRHRALEDEDRAMEELSAMLDQLIVLVGQNMAAWMVLEVERKYWQGRNLAAQLQKNRQDVLGLGWANHDHHTFRSSRRHFKQLVHIFEKLGFHCRERFYAGLEAGWGAQVMENPTCRLVLFLDVDLAPHEIEGDFAHEQLPESDHLGTIGLWCALHGDSILRAGMHHLEAQFMFEELTHDLNKLGVKMMHPFSSFPYLKQAFTVGEMWPVEESRIQRLIRENKITEEHASKFRTQGALGSHLENLQRREGYKGFNQKNVSLIIKKTDPRHHASNEG